MEKEFNVEREQLLANNTTVELELKTVTEDLTNQLTAAKSKVSQMSNACFFGVLTYFIYEITV